MDLRTAIIGKEQQVISRLLGGSYGSEDVDDWIGPYRLIGRLGEGGFGTVWRAEQCDPVQRVVALKVIKRGMDTHQVLSRFDHERQALASMDHPSIAALLDAGASADGRPYFAMELVHGESITQWCERCRSPLHERLRLFKQVCFAVNHAHQKGVIHRDLKPSNILVTSVDSLPTPKIIDFGIAKAIRATTLEEWTLLTQFDQLIGTPLYMSPEQIVGERMISTRSDIYALGVVLYELITGIPPFEVQGSGSRSLETLKRRILEDRPTKPSTLIKARKRLEGSSPAILPPFDSSMPNYSVDLDWIVFRALEKDPALRYQTAIEFADDVQRFLNREPIEARPPKFGYIAGRWIGRHRTIFASACAVVLAMVSATVISLHQANEARLARIHAEDQSTLARAAELDATREAGRAKQSADFLTDLLDRVTTEIEHGRNPEALKIALRDSEARISAIIADTHLQLQLLERVAGIYQSIGETKQLIPLLKVTAEISAKHHGASSETAYKAELEYIKVVTDHGNRITAPELIKDLRGRVEASQGRGSKCWFDVQRQFVRAQAKLKRPEEAVAAAEDGLTEMDKQNLSAKQRVSYIITSLEAFGIAGKFSRASELLDQCAQANQELGSEAVAAQILDKRVLLLWSQRDFASAAVVLREMVAGLKKKHGEQAPEVLEKLIDLVDYEIDAKELTQALTDAKEALTSARAHPDRREDLCLALICLAKSEGYSGLYENAISHAAEAYAISTELGKTGTIHRCTQMLAILNEDAGHLEEAATYYQLYQRHIEAEHANYKETLEVMEEICHIRVRQGRTDEGMRMAQEIWARLRSVPESHDDLAFTSEIASLCLVAHKAWRAVNPNAPEIENYTAWRAANAAAKASESYFSRLRKEPQ
jgi:eukaryotic-like serine/threonine-protein kinase